MEKITKKIKTKIELLPRKPGVYLMKNKKSEIIYVGKASVLKNRVKSYFSGQIKNLKTKLLIKSIFDFEYIITSSEDEAFILESNYIKKHKPKYNILLKDDKKYPFIKITLDEDFPRVIVTRELKRDKGKYFGPYHETSSVRRTIRLIEWIFPIRTCKRKINEVGKSYDRPCINYQLGKCKAPCVKKISKREYGCIIKDIIDFLNGKDQQILKNLNEKMTGLAKNLNFEKAAKIRDKIKSIKKVQSKQRVYFTDLKNRDVIGFYRIDKYAAVTILKIVSGKLLNREVYRLDNVELQDAEMLLEEFIKQYYSNKLNKLPYEIICQITPNSLSALNRWLNNKLRIPQKGEMKKLIKIAKENAFNLVESDKLKHLKKKERTILPVKELKDNLKLMNLPRKMVCFDISTIQGTDTVASMVFFQNGKPKKKNYRHFIIKSINQQNDFAAMEEAVGRYLKKAVKTKLKPDLIIIDGGKGQLNIIDNLMKKMKIEEIDLISLAKRIEEVFLPDKKESIILKRSSSALRLLVNIRDEAHRFAITFHRKRRNLRTLASEIDNIPGIGSDKKFLLLKEFGSAKNIKNSSIEHLTKIKGIGKKTAKNILYYLNKNDSG